MHVQCSDKRKNLIVVAISSSFPGIRLISIFTSENSSKEHNIHMIYV